MLGYSAVNKSAMGGQGRERWLHAFIQSLAGQADLVNANCEEEAKEQRQLCTGSNKKVHCIETKDAE